MNYIVHTIEPRYQVYFDIRATYQCRTCSHYGKYHTCPPQIPSIDYWKELVGSYRTGELYIGLWDYSPDTFAEIRDESAKDLHHLLITQERECFEKNKYWAVSLIGGSCRLCPDGCGETCRFPERARAAMEGAGIDVITTCARLGSPLPHYPHPNNGGKLARVGLLLVE